MLDVLSEDRAERDGSRCVGLCMTRRDLADQLVLLRFPRFALEEMQRGHINAIWGEFVCHK